MHQTADAFPLIDTGGGNKQRLVDEIQVIMICDKEHTKTRNSRDDPDKNEFNSQWNMKTEANPYVRTVLALKECNNEHPPPL